MRSGFSIREIKNHQRRECPKLKKDLEGEREVRQDVNVPKNNSQRVFGG